MGYVQTVAADAGGTVIQFKNSDGKVIGLYNNSIDTNAGCPGQAKGTHWQAVIFSDVRDDNVQMCSRVTHEDNDMDVDVSHDNSKSNMLSSTLETKAELSASSLDERRSKKLADDLKKLEQVYNLIVKIQFEFKFSAQDLHEIGELLHKISWDEECKDCVRNKHGYRNRHKDKGNAINKLPDSAKIDFETLAHLQELPQESSHNWIYDHELVLSGLVELKQQIEVIFIEYKKHPALRQKQTLEDLVWSKFGYMPEFTKLEIQQGAEQLWEEYVVSSLTLIFGPHKDSEKFLIKVSSYHHDMRCVSELEKLVKIIDNVTYSNDKIARYSISYIFV